MLTINRFDGGYGNEGSSNPPQSSSSSRLAALSEKKRKRSDVESHQQPAPSVGPQIHPSRLASAPLLAQSVKKANNASGIKKEKTKAKQRYLNKKKLKRKAKKAAGVGKKKELTEEGMEAVQVVEVPPARVNENNLILKTTQAPPSPSSSSSSSSDDSSSDSDSDSDAGTNQDADIPPPSPPSPLDQDDPHPPTPPSLAPLPRNRPLHHTTQEALRSLAAQGLPRGMVQPTVVDPQLREPLQTTTTTSHLGISLAPTLARRLTEMGVTEWFAVQTAVIPHLLSTPSQPSPFHPPRDLCVSAPTGSGKTLAYAIPIISHLRTRVVPRLRALVILPTRDLILQVKETMQLLAKGTGLKIASTAGAQSFAQEQQVLVGAQEQVDILVTTPGRLVDHLDETPGFTLEHLRFLVIDEADRLLGQSFHDWAKRLRDSMAGGSAAIDTHGRSADVDTHDGSADVDTRAVHALHRLDRINPPRFDEAACDPFKPHSLAQKLLFSATLTRDVGKLSELGLRDPVFVDVSETSGGESAPTPTHGTFTLPSTLHEHMLVVSSAVKPLFLIWLLQMNPVRSEESKRKTQWVSRGGSPMQGVLVFTKSVDSAQRLVRLLQNFFSTQAQTISAYTSDLSPTQRRTILSDFKSGKVTILVASDLISRGIDVPSVQHVVSYDTPSDVAKYVHRSGRTARGGSAEGHCWSLVEEQEARWFKREVCAGDKIKRVQGRDVQRIKVEQGTVESDLGGGVAKERYQRALKELVEGYRGS